MLKIKKKKCYNISIVNLTLFIIILIAMKNYFLFTLFLFFYSYSINYVYTYKENEKSGGLIGFEKVGNRLVRKFYYSADGILEREEFFTKKKKMSNYRVYGYNNKLKVKDEYYNFRGDKLFLCRMRYNSKGQLEKKEVFYPDTGVYNIDLSGASGNANANKKSDHFYIYNYNSSGVLKERIERKDGKLRFRYLYFFKKNGLKVEKRNQKGTLIRTFEYEYDNDKKIIKASVVKANNS